MSARGEAKRSALLVLGGLLVGAEAVELAAWVLLVVVVVVAAEEADKKC